MRVEFYHVDAFEAANYEPIWRALRAMGVDAQMVAVPGNGNTADPSWFDFDRLAAYYRARGVPFVTAPDHDAVAITTQNESIIHPYRAPRIRLAYGPIMYPQAWGLQPHSVAPFDAVLVHGPKYVEIYSQWKERERLPIAGYPRYDDFFAGRIDRTAIARQWGVDPSRPTVAYLPTWGENGTIDRFFDAVQGLRRHYNVLVRPHHCTLRFEPPRWERLQRSGLTLLDNAYDLSAVYAVADVVLADTRSGGFFEGLACDRPSVGLVLDPAEIERWIRPTGAFELAPICAAPETLHDTVGALLAHDPWGDRRRAWATDRVSYRDGTAAQHAAEAIVRIAESVRGVPVKASRGRGQAMTLVMATGDDPSVLQQTVAGIAAQTIDGWELAVVAGGATRAWVDGLSDPRIRCTDADVGALLRDAAGEFVGLLVAGDFCAPPFLEALRAALAAEPAAAFAHASTAWTAADGGIERVQPAGACGYRALLTRHAGTVPLLVRRAALETIGVPDPRGGDAGVVDWCLRLAESAVGVRVPEVLAYRRASAARYATDELFLQHFRRHRGFEDLAAVYPTLSLCSDRDTAALHALLDFASLLLASPVDAAPLAEALLERAHALAPESPAVAANLVVARARQGRWQAGRDALAACAASTDELVAHIRLTLDEAARRADPERIRDVPVFGVDPQTSELLRRERRRQPVRAWSRPGANPGG